MITIDRKMTEAEAKLTARVNAMSLAELKTVAHETFKMAESGDDDAAVVNDFVIGRLAGIMSEVEFCEFCENMVDEISFADAK